MTAAEETLDRQEDIQDHGRNLQDAAARAPDESDKREYLEAIMQTDISPASIRMLRNMTSRSFILSYLNEAEVHEIKALRKITLKKILAAHPDDKAVMRGERRVDVYGEDAMDLKPLSDTQLVLMRQYIRASIADVARSKQGFQQTEIGKVSTESVKKNIDENDSGGVLPWK